MIRPAHTSEADAVGALVRDAYQRWVARFGRDPSPMHDNYARRIAAGDVWVLEKGGELLGLVVLRDGPGVVLLSNIAVAPGAQGQGFGRQLITFAEQEAQRRGTGAVRLFVNELMAENVAFYRHLGFVEVDLIDGEPADRRYVAMAKTVPVPPEP